MSSGSPGQDGEGSVPKKRSFKKMVESGFVADAENDAAADEADHPLLRLLDLVALPPVPSLQLKVGHPGGR